DDIEPYSESYGMTINLCNAVKKIEISGTIDCDIEPCSESYTIKMEQSIEQSINRVLESIKIETNQQIEGDLNMSNTQRRVVNVVLIDPDQGLPVEHSQVHDFGQIVTEDDDATTIQELIMTG